MTDNKIALQDLLEKSSDASLLREMIGYAAQRLMALETDALCGAGHGERTGERINHRNGFRDRDWETRAGISRRTPMPETTVTIPARRGKAAYVGSGCTIRVINTHGEQVVDTWAFNRHDISEFMSMEHSRSWFRRMIPHVGDALVTNHRRPILTVLEDTSGGVHDTMLAACDRYRYQQLGCTEYHDNCTDNLAQGLAALGLTPPDIPSPLSLFMNIPWTADGSLSLEPPISKPGCYIRLRAEMDLIIAFSACPMDLLPINGLAGKPTEAHFQIE